MYRYCVAGVVAASVAILLAPADSARAPEPEGGHRDGGSCAQARASDQAASSPAAVIAGGEARMRAWQAHVRLLESSPFRNMHWAPIGPSFQGGRIEAIAVAAPGSSTIYVGPCAGNVWKTTDNGMTWTPIFEHQPAFAIGDIAVAPSNPEIVWVGTGEVQPRHSGPAFAGLGVFKSEDAGATWTHMGLSDTYHVGKIVIHPRNPDIVYVAAMGHFRSTNAERGVFRTSDAGKTWEKVLFVSERTGAIDLAMDPSEPRILYASMWQMPGGPESGIYRTKDGGRTWARLANGLPDGPLGRAGLDIALSDPRIVYAFIDNQAPSALSAQRNRTIVGGEVYRSADRGDTWRRANTEDLYSVFGIYGWKFADVRVSPDDPDEIFILGNRAFHSTDGGRTYQRIGETIRRVNTLEGTAMHLDQHELWIDPANPDRLLLGNDGGVFTSWDRGRTWLHLNNLPIGQFYFVTADMADPYHILGGTQDDGAVVGPSTYRLEEEPAANDPWRHVWLDRWTGGDAFVTLPDPTDPRWIYYEHQNGDMRRIDSSAGNPFSGGPATDSIRPRPPAGQTWRFGWFTPFLVSRHDPRTLYAGANVVLKTTNRGNDWRAISPDLGEQAGGERALVPYGAISALAESPFAPGVLYAGTEGGQVHVTRNDGRNWAKVDVGLPAKWVSSLAASAHDPGTAYVAMSGYREDDFTPYLYRTDDFGRTWTSIAGLPAGPVNVVREDPARRDILYAGTDLGVYVSLDRGATWLSLSADLPTTSVYDLFVHPREGDLIAATHGRSLFLLDVRPVQALTDAIRAGGLHLFDLRPVTLEWQVTREVPPNPPRGRVAIHFWVKSPAEVAVTVRDASGSLVRTLALSARAGVNSLTWDTRAEDGRDVPPGIYAIEIASGGARQSKRVTLTTRR